MTTKRQGKVWRALGRVGHGILLAVGILAFLLMCVVGVWLSNNAAGESDARSGTVEPEAADVAPHEELGVGQGSAQGAAASDAPAQATDAANSATTANADALQEVQVAYVSDGDTIIVKLADGSEARVRLVGVDTPESVAYDATLNCEEGIKASDFTKSLVPVGKTVWLQRDVTDHDRYGRLLRYVWLEKPTNPSDETEIATKMLDALLVREGYAQVKYYWPDTSHYDLFKQWGQEAIDEGKGVTNKWA